MNVWNQPVSRFVHAQRDPQTGGYRSAVNGPVTAYGTAYALLTLSYLDEKPVDLDQSLDFLQALQCPKAGWFDGPELPPADQAPFNGMHDREHLLHHLTCTVIPALAQFGRTPRHPLSEAGRYTDPAYLQDWFANRDMTNAWFEGNNLLFVGQLLLYLRDHAGHADAALALEQWFAWHDQQLDPRTGVWGSDRGSDVRSAIFGGYHQLILYYDQRDEIRHHEALIDAVLSIQHPDGGFSKTRGGGACEDVDSVDILVNLYKRYDYRRPEIRVALRDCLRLILNTQNEDGGFSYKHGCDYVHMGMEMTRDRGGESGLFPTWFRVHTLALIAQVLQDEAVLSSTSLGFSSQVSMGWHDPARFPPLSLPAESLEQEAAVRRRHRFAKLPRRLSARLERPMFAARVKAARVKRFLLHRQ